MKGVIKDFKHFKILIAYISAQINEGIIYFSSKGDLLIRTLNSNSVLLLEGIMSHNSFEFLDNLSEEEDKLLIEPFKIGVNFEHLHDYIKNYTDAPCNFEVTENRFNFQQENLSCQIHRLELEADINLESPKIPKLREYHCDYSSLARELKSVSSKQETMTIAASETELSIKLGGVLSSSEVRPTLGEINILDNPCPGVMTSKFSVDYVLKNITIMSKLKADIIFILCGDDYPIFIKSVDEKLKITTIISCK
jgi:hypothetical protein